MKILQLKIIINTGKTTGTHLPQSSELDLPMLDPLHTFICTVMLVDGNSLVTTTVSITDTSFSLMKYTD